MPVSSFKSSKSASNASTANEAPPRGKAKSRFAGLKPAEGGAPMPSPGSYRMQLVSYRENDSGRTVIIKMRIVTIKSGGEGQFAGEEVVCLQNMVDKFNVGRKHFLSHVMAAAGFESADDYAEFDPEGEFAESLLGAANEYSDRGDTTIGRYVDADVSKGNDDGDGGYYRNWSWTAVADEEQPNV
jgi:hypothetical protein